MDEHGKLHMRSSTGNQRTQSSLITRACCFVPIVLFLIGFFAGEGKHGAAHSDFYLYHLPAIMAFHVNSWSEAVRNYSSATTPLFHILGSLNPLLGHDKSFRASYMLFCLAFYFVFVYLLRLRFREMGSSKEWAWIVGGTLLLSPYFRSQAFWPMTDNLALIFVILSAVLIEIILKDKRKLSGSAHKLLIASILLSCLCAFYTRQTYLFLSCYAIIFLWAKLRRDRWVLLSVVPMVIPAFYLFTIWHGLVPPAFQQRHEGFSFGAILFPLVMITFYSTPFIVDIVFREGNVFARPNRKTLQRIALAIAGAVPFWMIFHRYLELAYASSGGLLLNTLHKCGTNLGPDLFLIFAYIGLLILYCLGKVCSRSSNLLLGLFLLTFLSLKIDFQRYFDPLLIILFWGYMDRSVIQKFVTIRAASILIAFETILCLGEILHNH